MRGLAVTGSVLIRFDPGLTNASHLLRILDRARLTPASPDDMPSVRNHGFGLANTSLVLAVAGEMAAPVLLPVCAVLLVGSNLGTFRAAGRQLLRGQLGLPVLYTSIVAATLASGQFIASAAMSWMLTFWRRGTRDQMTSARAGCWARSSNSRVTSGWPCRMASMSKSRSTTSSRTT